MEGSAEFRILKDKWTAVSADDKRYEMMMGGQKYTFSWVEGHKNLTSSSVFYLHSCRSAQFEHTVVITSDGVDILTKLPEESNLWPDVIYLLTSTPSFYKSVYIKEGLIYIHSVYTEYKSV